MTADLENENYSPSNYGPFSDDICSSKKIMQYFVFMWLYYLSKKMKTFLNIIPKLKGGRKGLQSDAKRYRIPEKVDLSKQMKEGKKKRRNKGKNGTQTLTQMNQSIFKRAEKRQKRTTGLDFYANTEGERSKRICLHPCKNLTVSLKEHVLVSLLISKSMFQRCYLCLPCGF